MVEGGRTGGRVFLVDFGGVQARCKCNRRGPAAAHCRQRMFQQRPSAVSALPPRPQRAPCCRCTAGRRQLSGGLAGVHDCGHLWVHGARAGGGRCFLVLDPRVLLADGVPCVAPCPFLPARRLALLPTAAAGPAVPAVAARSSAAPPPPPPTCMGWAACCCSCCRGGRPRRSRLTACAPTSARVGSFSGSQRRLDIAGGSPQRCWPPCTADRASDWRCSRQGSPLR